MIWLAYALLGGSIFVLSFQFFKFGARTKEEGLVKTTTSKSLILKLSLPIIRAYLLPSVKNLKIDNFRKSMKRQISAAGLQEEITPDELFSLKIFMVIILPLTGFVYNL